jgi:peptidylprolyl isomerase
MIAMSEGDTPLEFVLGSERVINGLNRAIVGMHEGENKTVTISSDEGFGPREGKLIFRVRRAALPSDVKVGDRVPALLGDKPVRVWVIALEEEFATVDGNHPFAGQSLVLQIHVIAIRSAIAAPVAATKASAPAQSRASAPPRPGSPARKQSRHHRRGKP